MFVTACRQRVFYLPVFDNKYCTSSGSGLFSRTVSEKQTRLQYKYMCRFPILTGIKI